jgi:hypothetical protein
MAGHGHPHILWESGVHKGLEPPRQFRALPNLRVQKYHTAILASHVLVGVGDAHQARLAKDVRARTALHDLVVAGVFVVFPTHHTTTHVYFFLIFDGEFAMPMVSYLARAWYKVMCVIFNYGRIGILNRRGQSV